MNLFQARPGRKVEVLMAARHAETGRENTALFENLQRLETLGDKHGSSMARNAIVERNMRLVYWYANRYRWVERSGLTEMGDLIGAGVIGLYRAIDKFDVSKGFAFSTYARHWVRNQVDEAARGGDVVKVYHGWLPGGTAISLDAYVGVEHGGRMTRHEVIASEEPGPESFAADSEARETCRLVGERMGERTAVAMARRFDGCGRTYREIAEGVGVTKQAVHCMELRFVQNVQRELRRTG